MKEKMREEISQCAILGKKKRRKMSIFRMIDHVDLFVNALTYRNRISTPLSKEINESTCS